MKQHLILSLLILTFSCNSSKKIYKNNHFEEIYTSQIGGKDVFDYEHITSNEDYIALIESLNIQEVENDKLLDLDFVKNDVVIIYLGHKNTGGYSISVENLYWQNNVLNIQTKITKPDKRENVIMVITNPYCIVSIPKAKELKINQ